MQIEFEWDPSKAERNRRKHGVSFEDARSVFYDEDARFMADPGHDGEDRFLLLGMSSSSRILVVCHCWRNADSTIRIISARKAAKNEQVQYWERPR